MVQNSFTLTIPSLNQHLLVYELYRGRYSIWEWYGDTSTMRKVVLMIIFMVVIVVIFYPITQPAAAATPTPTEQEQKIAAFLGNDPNKINNPIYRWVATEVIRTENTGNRALVIIVSDTSWSALIQDTDITQRTIDNSWSKSIDF